ncbi:GntR family transcriptional regulator [Nocardia sp. NBC_01730]|uniref:GntR family transcriptional regulator n=1 Tax=Nocardia sp. NBC_01730 TaxID=2975998 RepID=UPI002E0D4B82|nr:GntR family transcriptional regulator [Nocardia sp. NBC_01730]
MTGLSAGHGGRKAGYPTDTLGWLYVYLVVYTKDLGGILTHRDHSIGDDMTEPAYVRIAGELSRQIRAGELPPGTQLRSLDELAERNGVSRIVIRKAVELLLGQGLVRTVRRQGTFVADSPNHTRVSPERQLEDPEITFRNESANGSVVVERDTSTVEATDELAEKLGVEVGAQLVHVITRASEDRRPISISDTYQPIGAPGVETAALLEETISDSLPAVTHADWLGTTPGELVKSVNQRYLTADGGVLMISTISYPRDLYTAFLFRMALPGASGPGSAEAAPAP